MYNKFVSNTIRNSEDGDVPEEAYSSDSDYDKDDRVNEKIEPSSGQTYSPELKRN